MSVIKQSKAFVILNFTGLKILRFYKTLFETQPADFL